MYCFILCEKKHEQICSSASTSLKNPLLVWDCGQSALVNSLTNDSYAGFFLHSMKIRDLLLEYTYTDLQEYVFIVNV